jgi:hypothetical protein
MAWEVPIKIGDEEYPVTFNTENEPTEADINEAVAQITKGQAPDPAPVEKAPEPMLDISDTLKATGQALGGLPTTAPHAYRQLSEGLNNPWERSPEYTQSKSEMAKYAEELEQSNLEAEKSGDISSFSRGMRQAGPSLGFSAGAMGSSVAGGSAAGTAGRYIGALAGPEGAVAGELVGRGVGALGASYGAAYRMAGAQFLDDAREAIDEKFQRLHKRLPTKEEQVEAYKELLPLAEAFGHAEAGPEAIGNLAMGGAGRFVFGLGKKKIVQLADSALKKATMKAGAAAGALGTEFAGETATQVEQSRIDKEAKALIAGEAPPELTDRTVEDYQKAFGEVAPATAATTLLMGGAGAVLGGAKRLMTTPEEKEGVQVSPNTLPESAGLGRPVVDVIAESDALSAQAVQQAVAADSPLMAEAIVENAAAPTPEADKVAETGTTEPVVQEPGATGEVTNEAPAEQEVKATNNPRLARFSDDELQARWQIADTRSQELGNPMAPVWADEAKMLSQEIGLRQSQVSSTGINDEAAYQEARAKAIKDAEEIVARKARNTDLFPDKTDFMGKLSHEATLSSYQERNGFGVAEYANPTTGLTDVYLAAFGDNDFIAYIRVYDENGKPTNQFTSKLERRSKAPGVTKAMLADLQSRLPEGHEYTEDVSVSTDGLKFIASQLNQGYEVATDQNGKPQTREVAISGESLVNDLPINVDPNGKFENIRITNRKDFDKVRPVLGKMLERFGVGLGEQNVHWENGTAFIDIPVLRKKPSATAQQSPQAVTTNDAATPLEQGGSDAFAGEPRTPPEGSIPDVTAEKVPDNKPLSNTEPMGQGVRGADTESITNNLPLVESGDIGAGMKEGNKQKVQRDTSKPEQMTPEEGAGYKLPRGRGADILPSMDMMAGDTPVSARTRTLDHAIETATAARSQKPVSKVAVDTYGIKLPEGYVAEGELYVYRPDGKKQGASASRSQMRLPQEVGATPNSTRKVSSSNPKVPKKEPWQMTKGEMDSKYWDGRDVSVSELMHRSKWQASADADHKAAIQQALHEGKPVPGEVLAEYPDLRLEYLKSREVNTAGGTSLSDAEDAELADIQTAQRNGFSRTDIQVPTFDSLSEYAKEGYATGERITSGVAAGFISTPDTYFVDPSQMPKGSVMDSDLQGYAYPKSNGKVGYIFMDLDGVVKDGIAPDELAAKVGKLQKAAKVDKKKAKKPANATNLHETTDPETVASQARQREREAIGEERKQRGDEKPITDSKAPVAQGEFVTWQAEDGTMREGVLTKANAGRNGAGEAVSEVTLESSEVVQVPRRELQAIGDTQPSIAQEGSLRSNPIKDARAKAIADLRGSLGQVVGEGASAVDAINAVTELQGQVPGVQKAWVGTRAEFLEDEKLTQAFPEVTIRIKDPKTGHLTEGLHHGGRAFVFTDQVGIYEGDIATAAEKDITPGQAAVQRVITHEALVHRGFYGLDTPTRRALFQWGAQNIYEAEMDAKAEEAGYGSKKDWRTDRDTREFLMEEIMAKMIERLKSPPKSGPLKQLWDILAAIWRKLSGKSREVTLKDVQDVAKLLRTALELAENNVETRSGMPIKVDVARPSLRGTGETPQGDSKQVEKEIDSLAPLFVKAAQEEYDAWTQDENGIDDEFGGGGICDAIANQISTILAENGFETAEGGQEGDDHAYVFTAKDGHAFGVDIPPYIYETGAGYSWKKKEGVQFVPDHIEVYPVKYEDVFGEQPMFSIRPQYTTPLDQTLANTAKAVRLMRDGPPAVPVNMQQVYQAAVKGKPSAMVSLDDLFATAKQVHPELTEAEFGQQVQSLYDDNGAYVEPAESVDVMKADGEKYGVRVNGVPVSFIMVLDDEPVRASYRQGSNDFTSALEPEVAGKLQQAVWVDQLASGKDSVSEQTKIVDQPDYIKTERDYENTVKTAVQIVDALLASGVPLDQLPNALTNYGVQKQLGYERDPVLLNVLLTEAMQRGAPNATKIFQEERSGMGGGLGVAAFLHKHPRYQNMFMIDGIKEAHQKQANDIAEANADIKDGEIKKVDAESNQVSGQEIAESAEEAAFRQGEESLSAEDKPLWQKIKDRITRIGFALQKLAGLEAKSDTNTKASLAGNVSSAELAAMDKMTAEQLRAFIANEQKELTADLKKMMGKGPKAKANPQAGRIATLVNRLSEQLGVPTDITTAVEALTASQDTLRNQFEQSIVDSLVNKTRAAITPKQAPSKNLNSVIKQITRILADNLNLPKNTTGAESLGEKAIDAFGRVRNNEQLIREAWEKAREQIRVELAKRATEGLEGLTEEEAADIENLVEEQLASIASEVPAHLWARGQAFSVLRDALAETTFDSNTQILADPAGALKAARDKINQAVEKVGNVDPARWDSNQSYIIAAFNQLVEDLQAAKAKSDKRRRAAQKAGVFSPAEAKTFNRLMDQAHKRSGDKSPMLPENISWTKLFSGSPQSQEAKAKQMMEYMKQDPVLSNLDPKEQQELADMFSKRWEAKREELTAAKVAAVLKRRFATEKGKQAVKGAIPKFIQAINRGELNNDIIAQDIAEKFGFEKLTDAENKKLETLAKELQEPNISVHDRRAKTDEIVKIIARKTGLSTAEILSAWWVTSVLSGPRTIFTIGMAFLSGGFEVFTHAAATVINAHLQGRRGEGTEAAMQSLTNYFKSYPRAVQLAWQYVRTGDKNLLADSDPAFMQFFDTGRNNPQSIGWRMTQSKNPATRMLGRFMHFFEKLLTAGDLFNSTITRHGMLPVAQFLNSKTYEKARVASETDLSNYRKKALDQWWGGTEPKTGKEQALVTRQSIDLMEAVLTKYANVIEDSNFVAAQSAMTLNPEGVGGKAYKAILGVSNRATSSSAKAVKAADMLKAGEVGAVNKMTQQVMAFLYHFATHQMLNLGGFRFARFAGNKLNQSIGFIPVLGLARLYEKDYAGQMKQQAIIKNQVIGAVIAMVGISILKAISDEPDDEKRGWGWQGSWAGLSAAKIKQLMAAGLKPNSVSFNGNVFNYSNWPISSLMAAIGSVADRIKYDPEDWEKATKPEVAYTGLWAATTSTFDTSAMSQLMEIFGSNVHSRDPVDASAKKLSRIFGNFFGGFIPRILKEVDLGAFGTLAGAGDGNLRKYEGWENFAKEVPYYRRYVGGPLLDIFAQQVEVGRSPWSREYQAQPEAREYQLLGQMGSNGLWLTPADPGNRRVGKGRRSREMTDAEQKRFVSIVGENYRQLVLKHGDRLNGMKHEAAKDMLGKLSDVARDRAERAALVAPPEAQP